MVERIKAIMAHYQLKSSQFSDAIGMQRSAVSHVLSERNRPSLDFVLRIKRHFPEINLDWLILGEGSMMESRHSEHPAHVSQDLFSDTPVSKDVPNPTKKIEMLDFISKDQTKATQEPEAKVKEEDFAPYGKQKTNSSIERVLFVYNDGTFREYTPRN